MFMQKIGLHSFFHYGHLAELISRTQLSVLVPATTVEGNKEPSYYFTFYAET